MGTIGILALQGDYAEHAKAMEKLGFKTKAVRLPEDLDGIDKMIIPGGESTTISLLAEKYGLIEPLKELIDSGKPVWGTCAGLILLADHLGKLPVKIKRNFLGSQRNSFEAKLDVPAISNKPMQAMFIRPPKIESVDKRVEILAEHKFGSENSPVAVRYKNILAMSFHSELDSTNIFSRFFLYDF